MSRSVPEVSWCVREGRQQRSDAADSQADRFLSHVHLSRRQADASSIVPCGRVARMGFGMPSVICPSLYGDVSGSRSSRSANDESYGDVSVRRETYVTESS